MTVVLRLLGLNTKAGSEDIRRFFQNLCIPDGGVYIIGGSLGQAFIVFTSERDGQLAMRRSGSLLRGSPVTLYVSSIDELQHKMESKLQNEKHPATLLKESIASLPLTKAEQVSLLDPTTALLLGLVAAIQGLQSNHSEEENKAVSFKPPTRSKITAIPVEELSSPVPGYVRLFGLPSSVTKQDVCTFFKGLPVQEIIANVILGCGRGCLVKFLDIKNVSDALLFNKRQLGSICVEVRGASEKLWTYAVQQCENPTSEPQSHRSSCKPHGASTGHGAPSKIRYKRTSADPSPSCFLKRPRYDSPSPVGEHCIMVKNLPHNTTKTKIKELFGCQNISNSRVIHLLDTNRLLTDTAFVIFDQPEDYVHAMNLNGCRVGPQTLDISSITREKMQAMLSEAFSPNQYIFSKGINTKWRHEMETPKVRRLLTAKICLYVRNLPADVHKTEIKELFSQFETDERLIFLLTKKGKGIGEAVVQFKTEKLAEMALRVNGQNFLGTDVILTCISIQQMNDILSRNH